jgi:hypothetical protein
MGYAKPVDVPLLFKLWADNSIRRAEIAQRLGLSHAGLARAVATYGLPPPRAAAAVAERGQPDARGNRRACQRVPRAALRHAACRATGRHVLQGLQVAAWHLPAALIV